MTQVVPFFSLSKAPHGNVYTAICSMPGAAPGRCNEKRSNKLMLLLFFNIMQVKRLLLQLRHLLLLLRANRQRPVYHRLKIPMHFLQCAWL